MGSRGTPRQSFFRGLTLYDVRALQPLPLLAMLATGCANPGPPRPPSLNLPELVTDLAVERLGNTLELRWTTPSNSTDQLPLKGPLTVQVCESPTIAEDACQLALTSTIHAGPSHATVTLQPRSLSGPPALLLVRLRILNAVRKSAGWSAPAFTATGDAPAPVIGLHASAIEGGAKLEWTQVSGAAPVLLHRTQLSPAPPPPSTRGHNKIATETDLSAISPQDADPGGTLDRTALEDHVYQYTAQRVRTATVAGHTVELLSQPSAPVTVRVRDTFPPAAPRGLVAVPGSSGSTVPTIELSWDPSPEADLGGYWVERADADSGIETTPAWKRLTPKLIQAPAFRDDSVTAGHRYLYRVLAVDTQGNMGVPSDPVAETAAAPVSF